MEENSRVIVIVNKDWEAAPLMSALEEKKARPPQIDSKFISKEKLNGPRATVTISKTLFELWCITDIMPKDAHPSSSAAKATALPRVFQGKSPDLVIAVGTASHPSPIPLNGCVSLGSNVLSVDPWASPLRPTERELPTDRLQDQRFGKFQFSKLKDDFFRTIGEEFRFSAEARFIKPPLNPVDSPRILAVHGHVALGVVNITNYSDYAWADAAAINLYNQGNFGYSIGSMETTHGLIRMQSEAPFLFVSGIANRLGVFDYETGSRSYAQNFAAAHNAGITLLWLLPEIARQVETKK